MKSYINVYQKDKDTLVHSYVENGIRKVEDVHYQPILGVLKSKLDGSKSEYHTIFNEPLTVNRFDSMSDAQQAKKSEEKDIYGDMQYPCMFITENYSGRLTPQKEYWNIYNIDIETYDIDKIGGFPKPEKAEHQIVLITFQNMVTNVYYVFGLKEYTPTKKNVRYFKCNDELHLLRSIIDFFNRQKIDVITGWNLEGFDIPYIVNRITKLLGEDFAKRLSPINKIIKQEKMLNKKSQYVYNIVGIINWDYLTLYKKFTFDNRESYALNYIASYELGKEKLKYQEEYGNLNTLYEENYELFVNYNIMDCTLVYEIDIKIKFIDIAISYTHSMFCIPDGIFGTLQPWDSLIYHELYHSNILIPPTSKHDNEEYLGGYVKDPQRGMHKWISICDIVSSYPNQMISFNMSPETIVSDDIVLKTPELNNIKRKYASIESCIDISELKSITPILQNHNMTFTCNGQFFNRETQGFIPKLVEEAFNNRLDVKRQISKLKDEKHELEKLLK